MLCFFVNERLSTSRSCLLVNVEITTGSKEGGIEIPRFERLIRCGTKSVAAYS